MRLRLVFPAKCTHDQHQHDPTHQTEAAPLQIDDRLGEIGEQRGQRVGDQLEHIAHDRDISLFARADGQGAQRPDGEEGRDREPARAADGCAGEGGASDDQQDRHAGRRDVAQIGRHQHRLGQRPGRAQRQQDRGKDTEESGKRGGGHGVVSKIDDEEWMIKDECIG